MVAAGIGLAEFLEDTVAGFRGDAGAGVAHRKTHQALLGQSDMDQHAAGLGEFQRIAGQVEQDLAQAAFVGMDIAERRVEAPGDFDAGGVGARRQQLGDALQQGFQPDLGDFQGDAAGVDAGIVEQVVDQGQQVFAGFASGRDIGGLVRGQRRALQQRQHAHDAVQRRADFVAHQAEKAFARLQPFLGGQRLILKTRRTHLVVCPGTIFSGDASTQRLRATQDKVKRTLL